MNMSSFIQLFIALIALNSSQQSEIITGLNSALSGCDCGENGNCWLQDRSEKYCDCHTGYVWNRTSDLCEGCGCPQGEDCEIEDNGEITCLCDFGYFWNRTSQVCDAVTCEEDTCKNGGTCTDYDATSLFKCLCAPGWAGDICEIRCDCGGMGTCDLDDEFGYKTCHCIEGYHWNSSSEVCNRCDCGEGDLCTIEDDGKKTCKCHSGYFWNKTSDICDECDCGEFGSCWMTDDGKKICECYVSYFWNRTSNVCEDAGCKDNPCENDGTCTDYYGRYFKCKCAPGWAGRTCEIRCDCGKNGYCTLKDPPYSRCVCDTGYLFNRTSDVCDGCDCGKNGSCKIDDAGNKICKCHEGYFWNRTSDVCEDCYCGRGSFYTFCTTGERKKCSCDKQYEFDEYGTGRCKECDCGAYGNCSFEKGKQICHCNKGYGSDDELRICRECDCGTPGSNCVFHQGRKTCHCEEGYLYNANATRLCERCYCGDYGKCDLSNGVMACVCTPRNAWDGTHTGVCEPCDCGDHGNCSRINGKRNCHCDEGYDFDEDRDKCVDDIHHAQSLKMAYAGLCIPIIMLCVGAAVYGRMNEKYVQHIFKIKRENRRPREEIETIEMPHQGVRENQEAAA